jgi:quercetin dioxygenase-like cupin family protein
MSKNNNFLLETTIEWKQLNWGLRRQVLGYDDHIMMVKVDFLTGGEGAVHSHVHSQSTYVASGVFDFEINGKKQIVKAGDGLYMEPNVPHGVKCLEAGLLIDTFSPVRKDFLK